MFRSLGVNAKLFPRKHALGLTFGNGWRSDGTPQVP
jgi:hypothetical protein